MSIKKGNIKKILHKWADFRIRILAWIALCAFLCITFMPCFVISCHAKVSEFNMEFPVRIVYNQEDIWTNGTGLDRSYFEFWKHGALKFLENDLIDAGVIHVSLDDSGYHFSLPAVNFNEKTGSSERYYLETIQMESMSFTCAEPIRLNTDVCYTDNVCAFNFLLDNPVRFYQKRDVYYSDDRYRCTYEYELKMDACRLTLLMGIENDELRTDTAQYDLAYRGVAHFINTDMGTDETTQEGENYVDEPSYYSFDWTYTDSPVTVTDLESGTFREQEKPKNQEVTQNADENAGEMGTDISTDIVEGNEPKPADKGEDGGLSLPGAIAAGAGAGVAGVGGAVAAAGALKGGGEEADEEKRKRYRMYVSKDFGDSIRKGARPVAIRARIVEIGKDNIEKERPDLAGRITVSGEGINISSAGVNGAFMEALVLADEDSASHEGTVTFTYMGEGGTFRNNIVFKLVGKPYVRFPETGSTDQSWILNAESYVDMIAGDGRTYPVMFYFEDAVSEPKILKFDKSDDIDVTAREADRLHTYYADVVNHTPSAEDNGDAFPTVTEKTVHIYAKFENGDVAEGDIHLNIYPEGLFVKASDDRIEDGRVLINAYEDQIFYGDDVEATPRFIPTRLSVMLAVSTAGGAEIIDGDKAEVQFGTFLGEGGAGEGLSEKMEYEISNVGSEYTIVSKKAYVEADDPFYMKLPVACEYQGTIYDREIPVRVIGAKPEPMQEWEQEYKKVLYAIKRYIDDGERTYYWVMLLKEHMDSGRFSAYTLRMMWWSVYYEYYDYEIAIGAGHRFDAEVFDWMVSAGEWTKWVCGVAFSYCAEAYTGNPIVGTFVQMAYEFVMDGIEEMTACIINNRDFKPENLNGYQHIVSAGDNIAGELVKGGVQDAFAGGLTRGAVTKSAMYIGAYMGYLVYKNLNVIYDERGEWDLPGAIFTTFKDMTTTVFKVIAGDLFEKWLKSKEFQTEAGKIVAEAAEKVFKKYPGLRPVDAGKIAAKFLDEAVGGGVGYIVDWTKHKADGIEMNITADNHIVVIFRLWEFEDYDPVCCGIDLTRSLQYVVSGPFSPFLILYDMLFGNLMGAEGTVSFPKDPKKVRQNRIKERFKKWD